MSFLLICFRLEVKLIEKVTAWQLGIQHAGQSKKVGLVLLISIPEHCSSTQVKYMDKFYNHAVTCLVGFIWTGSSLKLRFPQLFSFVKRPKSSLLSSLTNDFWIESSVSLLIISSQAASQLVEVQEIVENLRQILVLRTELACYDKKKKIFDT
jgi:hypothetical protein